MPDLEKQKQEFLTLCRENIKRDGLEDLLGWLQKSDFFTAPASTRYHGAYEGGLCEHSLDVYHMAKKAIAGYELELTEESVVVATLFLKWEDCLASHDTRPGKYTGTRKVN